MLVQYLRTHREGDSFYKEGFWQRAHWCQASPKGHNPGEWGGSQREAFLDKKPVILFATMANYMYALNA